MMETQEAKTVDAVLDAVKAEFAYQHFSQYWDAKTEQAVRQRLSLPLPAGVKVCGNTLRGYHCALEVGHSGFHETQDKFARWESDEVEQRIARNRPAQPAPTVATKEIPTINDVTLQGKAEEKEWEKG